MRVPHTENPFRTKAGQASQQAAEPIRTDHRGQLDDGRPRREGRGQRNPRETGEEPAPEAFHKIPAEPERHTLPPCRFPPQGMGQRGEQASVQADIRAHEQRAGCGERPRQSPEVVNRDGQPVEAGRGPRQTAEPTEPESVFPACGTCPKQEQGGRIQERRSRKRRHGIGHTDPEPRRAAKNPPEHIHEKNKPKAPSKVKRKDERGGRKKQSCHDASKGVTFKCSQLPVKTFLNKLFNQPVVLFLP